MDGFCGSNDQTNSVKALKEVVFLRIGFNPTMQVHLTVLQTYGCIQHTVIHNTKMNLSTVKWAPPMFGRATITLGIGPHSSCIVYYCVLYASVGL